MLNNISKIYIPYYLPNDKLQADLDSNENYNDFNVRFFHRQRINTFLNIIKSIPNIDKALDIGCGAGTYTNLLSRFASKVYAIDIEKKVNLRKQFIQMDIQRMGFKKNSFQFVICSEVLEHIDNIRDGLNEINRIVQPGGIVLFSMPNTISALWLRNRIIFNLSHLFNKSFSPLELEYKKHIESMLYQVISLLRKIGFKVLKTSGCFVVPLPVKAIYFLARKYPYLAYKICKLDSCLTNSYIKRYSSYLFVLCIKK